jgi:hypothetical protein
LRKFNTRERRDRFISTPSERCVTVTLLAAAAR